MKPARLFTSLKGAHQALFAEQCFAISPTEERVSKLLFRGEFSLLKKCLLHFLLAAPNKMLFITLKHYM